MGRPEQVRRILSTRDLTLYRVSERSAQLFGRSSRFYVPHNLYSDLADPSLSPTIHQMFALSHITNYRLRDWLAVFGLDLDLIPQFQLLVPRERTTLLDSSVYDTQAWIPWFAGRPQAGPARPTAPMTQLLAPTAPRRASDLLALGEKRFLYGKVGATDWHAFPHLAPGSIVRVDARQPADLLAGVKANAEAQLFFVEDALGWTCSQLAPLAKDRVLLLSPQYLCAQREVKLGSEGRILGVIDAELRPVRQTPNARLPPQWDGRSKARPPQRPNAPSGLKDLLRGARLRAGLSFREASSLSRWIASRLSDELYFAAASTLSDYETLSAPPRHIQKLITLCVLYSIDFSQFLERCGLPLDQAGREPIPDELVLRAAPNASHNLQAPGAEEGLGQQNGFLGALLEQWEEVPLFLRNSLNEITGLKNFSVSDVFWVGGDKTPSHPWLANAEFVAVNRRIKKPVASNAKVFCQQPLYLLLKRDGIYFCGPCTLQDGNLVVPAYPGGPFGAKQFRLGRDAEVIGQVTTIVRRLR